MPVLHNLSQDPKKVIYFDLRQLEVPKMLFKGAPSLPLGTFLVSVTARPETNKKVR